MEKTVVLIKPDGVKRALIGEIVSRFEKIGLKIIGMKMVWVDEEMVRKHYPTSRTEWVNKIGEKTLEAYAQLTDNPHKLPCAGQLKDVSGLKFISWMEPNQRPARGSSVNFSRSVFFRLDE